MTSRNLTEIRVVHAAEEQGLALANEALRRTGGDVDRAITWLEVDYRSRPDENERAVRACAVARVYQLAVADMLGRLARVDAEAA